MIVHARCQSGLAVARHGVGRHRDHRQLAETRLLTQFSRRRVAVHHRHLTIHQDAVERFVVEHLQSLGTVMGQHCGHAAFAQQLQRQLLIHFIVFHQQYLGTAQAGVSRLEFLLALKAGCRSRTQLVSLFLHGHSEVEGAALPEVALDPQFATHQIDQRLADGQPQPGAAVLARG